MKGQDRRDVYKRQPHSSGGLLWIDPKVKEETQKAKADGKSLAPITLIDKTYAHH